MKSKLLALIFLPLFAVASQTDLEESHSAATAFEFSLESYEVILYYSPNCPASQNVLKFLARTGKEIPMKNILEDRQFEEELLHYGGKKQVPCLFSKGTPCYDPHEIVGKLSLIANDENK